MSSIPLDDLSIRLGEPRQVTESIGHGWFPTIARFPTGELMVTHALVPDTNTNPFDLTGFLVSEDDGLSWGPRHDCLPEHQPMIYHADDDAALKGIPAYLFTDSPAGNEHFFGHGITIGNAGRSVQIEMRGVRVVDWPFAMNRLSNPHRSHSPRVDLYFDGTALQVGGRLLATMYGKRREDSLYSTFVAASEDGGNTWRYLATIAGPQAVSTASPRANGPCEPTMVQLVDGALMAVMRVGGGDEFKLLRSYSEDEGQSWSPPHPLAAYSVEPSLKRLDNETLVLSTGRPGIFLWFATDTRARTWQSIDVLAHHNAWAPDPSHQITAEQTTAYTELLEISPNQLLLVYDRVPFGWKPTPSDSRERNRIYLLPVTVERA